MAVRAAASMGTYGTTWDAHGYSGAGNVAGLLGSQAGRPALIAGGAKGVFEELAVAERAFGDDAPVILAANDVGMYLPRVDHWVSLHADNLGAWKAVRWLTARTQERTVYHAEMARPFVDYVWEGLRPLFCLSGYFAMQIAWLMGCRPIVLCGCPGEPAPRFFEATARADFGYGSGAAGSDRGVREQIEAEMRRLPEFKAAVRSMTPGSWTQRFFGGMG
jgi:hypothetical protein